MNIYGKVLVCISILTCLTCSSNQTESFLTEKNSEFYSYKISLKSSEPEKIIPSNLTTGNIQKGKSEGDTFYQIKGSPSYILSELPGPSVTDIPDDQHHELEIKAEFKSKAIKDSLFSTFSETVTWDILSLYDCTEQKESRPYYRLSVTDVDSLLAHNRYLQSDVFTDRVGTTQAVTMKNSTYHLYNYTLPELTDYLNSTFGMKVLPPDNQSSQTSYSFTIIDRDNEITLNQGLSLSPSDSTYTFIRLDDCQLKSQ